MHHRQRALEHEVLLLPLSICTNVAFEANKTVPMHVLTMSLRTQNIDTVEEMSTSGSSKSDSGL